MLMLMLNLINLQHALGASIPDCVIYSKYIFLKYIIVIRLNHMIRGYLCPPAVQKISFTRFIELAVKQVQFEHVNTGSYFFLFSWWWRWTG